NALQFAKMVEWGMTPLEAIQAATVTAARYLDRSGDVGAIAPGRYGDLIAVDGDPLADVRTLEKVTFVMKGGEVVKAP
ncbi:amidohydrolase family protein, partial [Acinetobacter baumannii]